MVAKELFSKISDIPTACLANYFPHLRNVQRKNKQTFNQLQLCDLVYVRVIPPRFVFMLKNITIAIFQACPETWNGI